MINKEIKNLLPVLFGIHFVALPLYSRMHPIILLLATLLTLWVYFIITKKIQQPRPILRSLVLIICVAFIIYAYGTLFGQQPGTSLLLLLSLLKIFEIKNKRDVGVIIFMGYFLIASNFFYTQSPLIALYIFLVVTYLTAVLIYLNDTLGTIGFKQHIKTASRFLVLSLPFMLILFVLFPRIPSPLWGLPKDTSIAKTGLSDELTLGNISQLVASGDVAFRVRFDDKTPPNNQLYWRGPVLTHYDGTTWRKQNAPSTTKPFLIDSANQPSYNYTLTLEPHNKTWLLALEHPTQFDSQYKLTRELQLQNVTRITNVISYNLRSTPNIINAGLFEQEAFRNIQLPIASNPQSKQLALRFFQQANGDPETMIQLILSFFREQPFFYTLTPSPLGQQAMDDFLFETKRGFCGHYASAFATLMRNAGIPTRVVTGYQGGELNPIDNYMIIRQSDAHAWNEVWIQNKGWLRVDPTAAVSPARIISGVSNAGLEASKLPSFIINDNAFLKRSRFIIDSMHNSWNKWVIGYNDKKQKQLFNNLGIDKINAGQLVLMLVITMTIAGSFISLLMLRTTTSAEKNIAVIHYNKFCNKFKSIGLSRAAFESEAAYLEKIKQQHPSSSRAAEIITNSYQQIRYNNNTDERYLKNFIRTVKAFKVTKLKS